jgi:hypothetical protein
MNEQEAIKKTIKLRVNDPDGYQKFRAENLEEAGKIGNAELGQFFLKVSFVFLLTNNTYLVLFAFRRSKRRKRRRI